MAGWLKHWFKQRPRISPKDGLKYYIDDRVVDYTITVLKEYGRRKSEGVVYLAGSQVGDEFFITAAVAPKLKASWYGFVTDHASNSQFVEFICDNGLEYISQVHSHPGKWVDHSDVDDEETAFRSEGLVSIVVPSFGKDGMKPLKLCGIHKYLGGKFHRLTSKYIQTHFAVKQIENSSIILKDFRNE